MSTAEAFPLSVGSPTEGYPRRALAGQRKIKVYPSAARNVNGGAVTLCGTAALGCDQHEWKPTPCHSGLVGVSPGRWRRQLHDKASPRVRSYSKSFQTAAPPL